VGVVIRKDIEKNEMLMMRRLQNGWSILISSTYSERLLSRISYRPALYLGFHMRARKQESVSAFPSLPFLLLFHSVYPALSFLVPTKSRAIIRSMGHYKLPQWIQAEPAVKRILVHSVGKK